MAVEVEKAKRDRQGTMPCHQTQSGGSAIMKTKSEFSQVARKAFWIPENERESIETIELAKFHRQFANCPVLLVHFETGLIYAAGPSEQSIELLFEENLSLPLEQFVFGPGSIDLRVEGDEDYEIKPPA